MKPSKLSNNFTGNSSEAPRLKGRAKRNRATGNALDMSVLFDDTKFGRKVQFTLNNNDNVNHHVALFAGILETVEEVTAVAGVKVDAIATNGVVMQDSDENTLVSCSCKNLGVIQRYIKEHPTRILSLQLSTDDESQWYLPITISKFDITRTLGSEEIMPSSYLKPSSPNAKLVVIDDIKHFQIDDRTIFDVVIGAGRQLQISIELGESIDSAVTLDEAAQNLL